MPTRTLPARDVTLADGRRLYYKAEESAHIAADGGRPSSLHTTKRGPNGVLRVIITVDDDPDLGEHYHLSTSYPEHTPTPDEVLAVAAALLPDGGHFGAMTPETNKHSLHGHVVHLIEEPPGSARAARRTDNPPSPEAVYITSDDRPGAQALRRPTPSHADHPTLIRAVREELGLAPPFTAPQFRTALDRLRGRRGVLPGTLSPYMCIAKDEQRGTYVIPVPEYAALVEREHAVLHGLGHLLAEHTPLTDGLYTMAQEREAEGVADALFTLMVCEDLRGLAGGAAPSKS